MFQRNDTGNSEQSAYTIILISLVLIVLIIALYQHFRYEINTGIGWVIQAQLIPFSYFFELPQKAIVWFSKVDLGEQSFRTMLVLLDLAGKYSRWFFMLFFIYWILKILSSDIIHNYMFKMNIKTLLQENVKWLPCLAPVINEDILSEDIDKGPWRAARQALQFCVENKLLYLAHDHKKMNPVDSTWKKEKIGLVLNKNGLPREDSPCLPDKNGYVPQSMRLVFDEEKALKVFVGQLGQKISEDWTKWEPHIIGLAAAFMAFACGDKDIAKELLDHMSLSFKKISPKHKKDTGLAKNPPTYTLDIGEARNIFDNYKDRPEVSRCFKLHGMYFSTLLMSLLMQAKQKGVLESSQYIWLRPYDRTLWYSLNQMGGYACWSEAAGPWAHYQYVETLGERSDTPHCQEAVNAMKSVLQSEGWLPQPKRPDADKSSPRPTPSPPKGPKGWAK